MILRANNFLINVFISLIVLTWVNNVNADAFPKTEITSKYSQSPYATSTYNVFAPTYKGECTWYTYARIIELVRKGELDGSVESDFYEALKVAGGRHARYWPNKLGGTWHSTSTTTLPMEKRRKGLVIVWQFGQHGHVGFVEEVNADKTKYRISDFNQKGGNISGDGKYKDNTWLPFVGNDTLNTGVYPSFYELKLASGSNNSSNNPPQLGDMYNDYKGISIANIQSFLDQFPNGDLKNKYLYNSFDLDENNFYQIETNWVLDEIRNGVSTMSPAEIIYYAAKENNINPVLLLAKIQQEQSIISRSATQHTLNRATGYDIPNSNPAGDPKYKSFLAQLTGLTYQFSKFRGLGLNFRQAYDKYTVDYTGQDASFDRFMTIYESYAVLMDEIVQGNANNSPPTTDIGLYLSENFVDKPTPMEWYRGCTTTAVSILLDWFGDHGYDNLDGEPIYASKAGCDTAYIRKDIANLYANNAKSTPLTCNKGEYGASPNDIVNGITYILENKGYCVNEDKDECWQIVNHNNLTVQDLVNTINNGFPLSLGVDSNTFKSNFDFENNFQRTINHRVVAYGYRTYENDRIEISLLTGWDTNWEDATRTIIINGDESTEIKERGLYVIPPKNPNARIITRASSVKRIFEHFNISQNLDSYFSFNRPSDVTSSNSYHDYIATAYNKGIVHGFASGDMQGKYGPFYSVSRVEFIKMVMNTLNIYFNIPIEASDFYEPVNVFGNSFPDMDYSAWYYKFVKAAYNYGIIQGTQGGNLQPHVKLSEKEAGFILDRAMKLIPANLSGGYSWHGNGSIISHHGSFLSNHDGKDWPYGITRDVVQLHASDDKPVGFFQWQVTESNCQNLKIDANGVDADITIGAWDNRSSDITFANVQLPFVLGPSNTGYRFDMEDGDWYVVKVALRDSLSSNLELDAICTTSSPTYANYQLGGGSSVLMDGGYKWNGNASVISHMFKSLYSKRNQSSFNDDWPFGAFKDVTVIKRSSDKPMVFFQWQRDDVCSSLTFDAVLPSNEKRVDIHVKSWNASNESAIVHRNVALPHTISDYSDNGDWRVVQIKFLQPVSYTADVTAKCSGVY
ncbi:S-layer homology domain-containing protein [Candidatus Halobeggiatoa sp. HSG11]|nr:S-layer homology domain-containing protein [Candidatus Halobeggiatoa sp. HSG11]